MILYSYDKDGVLVGPVAAKLSPAKPKNEDGTFNYIRPANSTDVAPPSVAAGYAAVFDAKTKVWSTVEDHRGQIIYKKTDGTGAKVTSLGPIPDGYTASPRPDALHVYEDGSGWILDLKTARESGASRIDALAENLRNTVITPGSGQLYTYLAKEEEAKAFVQDAEPTAGKYPYIYGGVGTSDGATAAEVAATYLKCAASWKAFGPSVESVRRKAKDAIAVATSQAEIESIISRAAWPTYGG